MLVSLSIENYALIEKLAIRFNGGFSTITGETGAGKSILLGAIGLVLGKRADLSSLKNENEKCIIEAVFRIKDYQLESFFNQYDLDYEDETIIRREILPSGKSRAFINDTPVNLTELQELGTFLIDIHSQHQTRELSEEDFQLMVIDSVAANFSLLSQYASSLKTYKTLQSVCREKENELALLVKEQDYTLFLFEELEAAQLDHVVLADIEDEANRLSNVEAIEDQFKTILARAGDEQLGVLVQLKEIKNALHKISGFSKEYEHLYDRIQSLVIEFDDIEKEVVAEAEKLISDPLQLQKINDKLQQIYALFKKHQVTTIQELLLLKGQLETKVFALNSLENEIKTLRSQIADKAAELDKIASAISENRKRAIPDLINELKQILSLLGMPNADFKIELSPSEHFLPNGKDKLSFMFTANKGGNFGVLAKTASGGEMSRIMLAVKSILARFGKKGYVLPTLILDEIDTGVSGEIAYKMGEIMKNMSQHMQLFAITHLPQIAAKGTEHFKVFKTITNDSTSTQLIKLTDEERITELAQMLSGAEITNAALNHAKELLN